MHAALELGSDAFWQVIEELLSSTSVDFETHLRQAVPGVSDVDAHRCGRALRRSICAALLDKTITAEEFHNDLQLLVAAHLSLTAGAGQAPGNGTIMQSAAIVAE